MRVKCRCLSLGLTPNATLCFQTTPPETPAEGPRPEGRLERPADDAPSPNGSALPEDEPAEEEPSLPPPLPRRLWEEAAARAGVPGA
ncbi:hypothetical protein GN956_G27045, partial [Arapaima gigas]